MDETTLILAKSYTDSVVLNGVAINNPRINPTTRHWEVFDPLTNSYIDTGIIAEGRGENGITPHIDPTTKHWFIGTVDTGVVAEGSANIQSISNAEIQAILNNLIGGIICKK